ncbi:PH domain-containing protein [Flavobacterium sp. MAH-1]|uniref:PH domain-containing protein n=2 Tax=Flavobacterium agri TaxID=2743471 RepID=A0A7Y8XZX0_9FLAO|nr:PH domain-containing protein [Flavobacterium agri]NUY79807.1 PH domain-containing protein [Flavobacterium agri]NYA69832.1 PH domain-containing protein [Flavobacterium agri]
MFAHTVQEWGRALFPMLIVLAVNLNNKKIIVGLMTIAIFLVIAIVVGWLRYRNFTFWIDEENEEFVITEGILNKSKTVIQLGKIQQVNIGQSLLQRIIGVYALDVDTAGSNKKEGKIRAISHGLALALKERLLENSGKIKSDVSNPEASETLDASEKPFINISFFSLFKYGITSNYLRTLGVILAFFATVYENVHRFMESSKYEANIDNYVGESLALKTGMILVGMLLLAILVINVLRVIIRYYGFRIARQKGSLLLSFGLINTKSTIIKPEKVQITTVSQNYFQKKLDILELRIRQATGGEEEKKRSAIEIPGCDARERDSILKLLFKSIPEKGVMLQPNYRKLVFSIFLSIVLPLGIAYMAIPSDVLSDFLWVFPLWTILRGLMLYFGFRNYRLFIHDKFIIKQSGAWDIANQIIEPEKIQALSVSQLFWHKSADIGYLTIYTAGGNLSFQLGDYTVIKGYVNKWLYEMETSDSNWM